MFAELCASAHTRENGKLNLGFLQSDVPIVLQSSFYRGFYDSQFRAQIVRFSELIPVSVTGQISYLGIRVGEALPPRPDIFIV